ncbi:MULTISPECIES: Gfo/Idh/MocA family protein [Thermoanaerobacterium]|uniref:Oxidoreductase domain protein n=1 Tax=Thermoanaerobacterium xylanolyticum (strain ATCC 49914 / DSM 7097 / LX-11) TaxID=858215 RepID=F6BGX0_THEXL|nr:Gfo/Idh/MocA family oxidoreductase [Thermoanaerobacterium xylanolyticum]AEF17517.1 oxidoreductase domain protein [Thermoanaerobacterium xylanolyticum LX-11]
MNKLKAIIVGPGNIFKRAYLPFIFNVDMLEVVGIVGRDEKKLLKYKENYKVSTYTSIDEAIALKPDCAFVHTSTDSHYEIVKKLLTNNIHVYVDKPLTDDLKKTEELYNIALNNSLILTVGFNRRYAPLYVKASENFGEQKPELYMMEKNRSGGVGGDIKFTLYDDFIHVVDTLCHQLGNVASINISHVRMIEENNSMKYINVEITSDNGIAIGVMHRNSGADREVLEVHGYGKSVIVENFEKLIVSDKNNVSIYSHNSWDSVSYVRGFESAVNNFLYSINSKEINDDEIKLSLKTHQLIDEILKKII